jgi:hypothetical protein
VRSIVDGSTFLFATQDGVAIPRDTLIHWMIVNQTP